MPSKKDQKKAFEFLVERFRDQKPFGKEDLRAVTSWAGSSLHTDDDEETDGDDGEDLEE